MPTDHYRALGIPEDADAATIREAYLRIMREHHPDHRPGDPLAADRARAANAAWEVLGDSARRGAYDRLRAQRAGGRDIRGQREAVRRPDAEVTTLAYSAERQQYRRDLSAAMLRLAIGVFAVGLAVLLALS